MKKKKTINSFNRINQLLDMPKEIISKEPKLTILGFNEILIENHKNILEYEEDFIRIKVFTGIINFWGRMLLLKQMEKDDVVIEGEIEKIEFEANTD